MAGCTRSDKSQSRCTTETGTIRMRLLVAEIFREKRVPALDTRKTLHMHTESDSSIDSHRTRCWRPFPKRIHQRACPRRLDSCGLRAWHLRRPPSVLVRLGLGHRFRLRPRMTGTRRSGVGCGSKQRRRINALARRGARWQGDSEWAGSGRRVKMTM